MNIQNILSKMQSFLEAYNKKLSKIIGYLYNNKLLVRVFFLFIIGMTCVIIYQFNVHTPLLADDYAYRYSLVTHLPIASVGDIVKSEYDHYFTWGGRVVDHSLAQLFLWQGKNVFNFINSLGYAILVMLIYLHATGKRAINNSLLIIILFALFNFLPAWGESMLWVVGAANYMWSVILALLFLLPLRLQQSRQEAIISNPLGIICYCVLGLLAGWTNENLTIGLNIIFLLYIVNYYLKHGKCHPYLYVSFAASILGGLLVILAPGNFVRLKGVEKIANKVKLWDNCKIIVKMFFDKKYCLIPITMIAILRLFSLESTKDKDHTWLIFLIGAFFTHISMLGAPYYADRSFTPVSIFLLVSLGNLIFKIFKEKSEKSEVIVFVLMLVLLGSLTLSYKDAYKDIKYYEKQNTERILYLADLKNQGQKTAAIRPVYPRTRYTGASGNEYWCDRILIGHMKLGLESEQ